MRHPRNKGERLALNRHLQVSGRDHRGRASKDQKIGTSIRRQTARKADMVEIELDYVFVTDPEPANGSTSHEEELGRYASEVLI